MYCPNCGNRVNEGEEFCTSCGTSLKQYEEFNLKCNTTMDKKYITQDIVSPEPKISLQYTEDEAECAEDEVTFRDLSIFLDVNERPYYMHIWKSIKHSRIPLTWNFFCFFMPYYWLAYKRMYGLAVSLISCVLVLSICSPASVITFNFIASTLLGFFGNKLYYEFAVKKVKYIKKTISMPILKDEQIRMQGGSSLTGLIIFSIVFFGLAMLFTYIFKMPRLQTVYFK